MHTRHSPSPRSLIWSAYRERGSEKERERRREREREEGIERERERERERKKEREREMDGTAVEKTKCVGRAFFFGPKLHKYSRAARPTLLSLTL
jgi:hypothetical protein